MPPGNFYARSLRLLREAAAPRQMNPQYWDWITARSSETRLLQLVAAGDTDALEAVLLQVGRRGNALGTDLPFNPDNRDDLEQRVINWPLYSPLDRTFLLWAYRYHSLPRLIFSEDGVRDLTLVGSLPPLESLFLTGTGVDDLSPLKGQTSLLRLDLDSTEVRDLSPLRGMAELRQLYIPHTKVVDLGPLAHLRELETLQAYDTKVRDLSPLKGLPKLRTLILDRTKVRDLSPLSSLSHMWVLSLNETKVTDISPLMSFSRLETLHIRGTNIPRADLDAFQRAHPECNVSDY